MRTTSGRCCRTAATAPAPSSVSPTTSMSHDATVKLKRAICLAFGHRWKRHSSGTSQVLVRCSFCGEVTDMAEARRIEHGRRGGGSFR